MSVELVHEEDDDHDEHSIKDDKVSKVFLETNLWYQRWLWSVVDVGKCQFFFKSIAIWTLVTIWMKNDVFYQTMENMISETLSSYYFNVQVPPQNDIILKIMLKYKTKNPFLNVKFFFFVKSWFSRFYYIAQMAENLTSKISSLPIYGPC